MPCVAWLFLLVCSWGSAPVTAPEPALLPEAGTAKPADARQPANPADARQQAIARHAQAMLQARQAGDDYAEYLHRGIGLFHLALQHAESGPGFHRETAEAALVRAAMALSHAQRLRPQAARPPVYLAEVWRLLGQSQPRRHCQFLARRALAGGADDLTDDERLLLNLHGGD
jgi:hypothetical protein